MSLLSHTVPILSHLSFLDISPIHTSEETCRDRLAMDTLYVTCRGPSSTWMRNLLRRVDGAARSQPSLEVSDDAATSRQHHT